MCFNYGYGGEGGRGGWLVKIGECLLFMDMKLVECFYVFIKLYKFENVILWLFIII